MDYKQTYKYWLNNVNSEENLGLSALSEDEIKERFFMPLEFGTAGMRGVLGLGTFRMNNYTVGLATAGLSEFIASLGADAKERGVVVSYDTRRCSLEFALVVSAVLAAYKIKGFLFEDVRPVPMCSFAVRHFKAVAGVMITASHNPKEYNGYKVYGEDGAQMSPEDTAKVVSYIDKIGDCFSVKKSKLLIPEKGIKGLDGYRLNDYITVVGKSVDDVYFDTISKLSLSPEALKSEGNNLKIVYTPLYGSGYMPVTTILKRMGVIPTLVEEQALPNPEFPGVDAPNPEQADALKLGIGLAKKVGAEVVIGTDPDCDRMGIALRADGGDYILLNGNQIGLLLTDYVLKRLTDIGAMEKGATVVKTIVTTTLVDKLAKSYGANTVDVLTGFKFIGEKIKEWEKTGEKTFVFGFEESFGYLRGTHARDKDAVVASMLFVEMAAYYKSVKKGIYERLIEIFETFGYYTEKNVSIFYKGLDGMAKMNDVMEKLRTVKIESLSDYPVEIFADYKTGAARLSDGTMEPITLPKTNALHYTLPDKNFVCVRPSGTEPKLKVYVLVSDETKALSAQKAEKILESIKAYL